METHLFHTLNRGVDKRQIFLDDQDRFRFIHDLYEFNDQDWVNTTFHIFKKYNDIGYRNIEGKKRKLLVDIHAFCLMPNHYHLLLSPKIKDGIPQFMKKLNMGYAKYFNRKYQRSGALFQGKYKSVLVKDESHFIHLPYYIHLNPLDIMAPEWRMGGVNNANKANNFLEKYRWSSFLDYTGVKNFPSVTNRLFLLDFFGGTRQYKNNVMQWLYDPVHMVEQVVEVVLE